jgi:hypothetical protein
MALVRESTRIRQNSRVASRIFDGQAEVITLDQPIRQHRLNGVGTRMWQLAESGATVEQLVTALCREYTVDEPTARRDALQFCDDLVARGILVIEAS